MNELTLTIHVLCQLLVIFLLGMKLEVHDVTLVLRD